MRRDRRVYLWEALRAADAVLAITGARTKEEYLADDVLRWAADRQLQIVGEALAQMSRRHPEAARQIPELGEIIGFRNILVHGYAGVDPERVWAIIRDELPSLRETLKHLLGEA